MGSEGGHSTFPDASRLAAASVDELRETGVGFRADYKSGFVNLATTALDTESWVERRNDDSFPYRPPQLKVVLKNCFLDEVKKPTGVRQRSHCEQVSPQRLRAPEFWSHG